MLAHRASNKSASVVYSRPFAGYRARVGCQKRACRVLVRATHKVCVLPGDGIGPEIMAVATRLLSAAGKREGEEFQFLTELIGGAAIDATGSPLPEKTLETAKACDAVLLAAIGG